MYKAPLMQEHQHAELLALNPTPDAHPSNLCLHHLFEHEVDKRPDSRCLKVSPDSDTWLTYSEVEAKANRVAHMLAGLGVGANKIVGVCAVRGPNLYIAMLGILKAGAAYLPMDANYPADRLAYMEETAGVKILLTDSELQADHDVPQTQQVGICSKYIHISTLSDRAR